MKADKLPRKLPDKPRKGFKFHRLLRLARRDIKDEQREIERGRIITRPHPFD